MHLLYKDNITLFTYHALTEMWYPHLISNVRFIASAGARATQQSGTVNEDAARLFINCTSNKVLTVQAGYESYLPPKEYAKLADPTGFITFTPESDFFILGVSSEALEDHLESWQQPVQEGTNLFIRTLDFQYARNEFNEPISDNDYESGLYDHFNNEYADVYKIASAAFFSLIPHFEIGGR